MNFAVAIAITVLANTAWAQPVLKHKPPSGSLHPGEIVLLDDGSCPRGKIKQITGGNSQTHTHRQVHCMTRK